MKNLTPEMLIEVLEKANDEQKSKIRELLGIGQKSATTATRISGKFQRTDKVLETKVAKQMQQLIDVLPKDRAVDIDEWTKLALDAGMQTQQEPVRITAYYKKAIVDGGYASVN